jgi:hypothetical protein
MDNIQNISKKFADAKEGLGLSLKDAADIVKRYRKEYGPIYEACIMCETLYNEVKQYVREASKGDADYGIFPFDFSGQMGLIIQAVDDEAAQLVPELGTENILLGSRLEIWKLLDYINLLKEQAGK